MANFLENVLLHKLGSGVLNKLKEIDMKEFTGWAKKGLVEKLKELEQDRTGPEGKPDGKSDIDNLIDDLEAGADAFGRAIDVVQAASAAKKAAQDASK